jgi:hypothetical protein
MIQEDLLMAQEGTNTFISFGTVWVSTEVCWEAVVGVRIEILCFDAYK